jgi:hypothetical protein
MCTTFDGDHGQRRRTMVAPQDVVQQPPNISQDWHNDRLAYHGGSSDRGASCRVDSCSEPLAQRVVGE